MATVEQRKQLLSRPCPWCKAGVGEECYTPGPKKARLPIKTLDAGCHDARWLAVFDRPAPVLLEREPRAPVDAGREPVPVGAVECPW